MKLNVKQNSIYDVVAIGSALLDITVEIDDELLSELGLQKSSMHLVESGQSHAILKRIKEFDVSYSPGGSSANTLAGVNDLGGRGLFLGSVGNDAYGNMYINETEKSGVKSNIGKYDEMTGTAITLVTSEGERTFATHLGAALNFSEEDVNEAEIAASSILHLEGYLFEMDNLYNACIKAMQAAKRNGVLVSIDLADSRLIERIYDRMRDSVENYADIVFADEEESLSFTGKKGKEALEDMGKLCSLAVVKIGARGSLIRASGQVYEIAPVKTEVVNTNGAGDMYAAGILYGLTQGLDVERAGRLASAAASLVVGRSSARLGEKVEGKSLI